MASPITWRTITGPNFNNSAGGQAIDAFRSAGSGFLDLTDSLRNTQQDLDEQTTNEAIRRSLELGQVDPNLDPRANSAAVWEAVLGKQEFDDNLLTSKANRENVASQIGLRSEQTEAAQYENTPERRAFLKSVDQAALDADVATKNLALARGTREEQEFQRQDTIRKQKNDLDLQLRRFGQQVEDDYLAQVVTPGREPTEADLLEAARLGNEAERSGDAQKFIERYVTDKNYLLDSYRASRMGSIETRADEAAAEDATSELEHQRMLERAGIQQQIDLSNGDMSSTIVRAGVMQPMTEADEKYETMGTYEEAIAKIGANPANPGVKINISRLRGAKPSSPEKIIIEHARKGVLPNASLLAAAIEAYVADDGELDVEGFTDTVDLIKGLGIQNRINAINAAREEAGLKPIDGGSISEDGEAVDPEGEVTAPANSAERLTQRLESYTQRLAAAREGVDNLSGEGFFAGNSKYVAEELLRGLRDNPGSPRQLLLQEEALEGLEKILAREKREAKIDRVFSDFNQRN
jgi:hypothetical protein